MNPSSSTTAVAVAGLARFALAGGLVVAGHTPYATLRRHAQWGCDICARRSEIAGPLKVGQGWLSGTSDHGELGTGRAPRTVLVRILQPVT